MRGAGKYRHVVSLQERVAGAADGQGGRAAPTWTDVVAPLAANVVPLAGREQFQQHQVNPSIDHRVEIRYRTGITSEMRILYGARELYIESILDVEERHREVHLMCKEKRAA